MWRQFSVIFDLQWHWPFDLSSENWQSTYACQGECLCQFWLFYIFCFRVTSRYGLDRQPLQERWTDARARCIMWPRGWPHKNWNCLILPTVNASWTLSLVFAIKLFARDSMYAKRAYAIAIPSVRLSVLLSVTRVDQSKTVQVRIMQFSPYSSPIPLVFCALSFIRKFWWVPPERGGSN